VIDLAALRTTLLHAHPLPMAGATLAWALGAACIGLRLRSAARSVGASLSLVRATAIGLSAAFASYVSFGAAAGEAARLAWLRRRLGAPAARALTVLIIDRIADGAAIVAVAVVAALALPGLAHAAVWALLPLFLAMVAVTFGRRWFASSPVQVLRAAVAAFPAALAGWALTLARMILIARAVGLGLDVRTCAALALAGLAGGQAPTPGGIGVVEASLFGVGMLLHLPPTYLVAFVLADRGVGLLLGTAIGGLASIALFRPSHRSSHDPA
jgi:uncharacterized membrane protein YbhN (UPF0104 family)